jgi:hypothetical protein
MRAMIESADMKSVAQIVLSGCIVAVSGCATRSKEPPTGTTREAQVAAACRANLREMQTIKQRWAAAEHKGPKDTITWQDLMQVDRYLIGRFECPAGGAYDWGRVSEPATCSISGHTPK